MVAGSQGKCWFCDERDAAIGKPGDGRMYCVQCWMHLQDSKIPQTEDAVGAAVVTGECDREHDVSPLASLAMDTAAAVPVAGANPRDCGPLPATIDVGGVVHPLCSKCREPMPWTGQALYESYTCSHCKSKFSGPRWHCVDHREDYCAACVPSNSRKANYRREVLCPETIRVGHRITSCAMIFTMCPNYWQRNYYCDRCGAVNKSGGRWHCQLHRKDICTNCEPGKDTIEVKNGVKCPKGNHWMCWSRNLNPRRRTYLCQDCGRCYINNAFRWHCTQDDVDFCPECEPGMAQKLKPGIRVKWMGSSQKTKALMENIGNGDTNLSKVQDESIGKIKHIVDDLWAAVAFPEGTWDFKRVELLIVDERDKVEGLCCECGALGIPGWNDPDIDDFFCEVCWEKFLAEPEDGVEGGEHIKIEEQPPKEIPWDTKYAQEKEIVIPEQKVYWDRDVGVRVVSAISEEEAAFKPGTDILVVNLVERPENNGRRGQVIRFDKDAKKYVIQPEGSEKLVKLRPENIKAVPLHRVCNWWNGEDLVLPEDSWRPSIKKEEERIKKEDAQKKKTLPEGWKSAWDEASGKEYYWPVHDRSGVTWDRPVASATPTTTAAIT